jgi:hypothetical protein
MADGFEYGFIADGRLHTKAFGIVPFTSPEMAEHTGSKWWTESLVIVRRLPDGEWEPVPGWPVRELS